MKKHDPQLDHFDNIVVNRLFAPDFAQPAHEPTDFYREKAIDQIQCAISNIAQAHSQTDLIVAIDCAAKEQNIVPLDQRKLLKIQEELKTVREDLEKALGREISLLYENYQLKKQLSALNGANIIPIRQSDYD